MFTSLLAAAALSSFWLAQSPTAHAEVLRHRPFITCDTRAQIERLAALSLGMSLLDAKAKVNDEHHDPAKPDVIVCGSVNVIFAERQRVAAIPTGAGLMDVAEVEVSSYYFEGHYVPVRPHQQWTLLFPPDRDNT